MTAYCNAQKAAFGDNYTFRQQGGMALLWWWDDACDPAGTQALRGEKHEGKATLHISHYIGDRRA
jgi:hypothetical protein